VLAHDGVCRDTRAAARFCRCARQNTEGTDDHMKETVQGHQITDEHIRLRTRFEDREGWKKWGPYVSERQWGTVREDYSPHGTAWDYFPHDHARSRAYRWGEDGIAGVSDVDQRLCLTLAMWNGRDPLLKERLYGLTNSEGNHGEDVKEIYYYLDATPTHSYLKMLYKYPQCEFPYSHLLEENQRRGIGQPEYELIDTGAFDADRYFDVFVEYAQVQPDDILMQVTAHNRGGQEAPLHLIPQLVFRNTWSWKEGEERPTTHLAANGSIVCARRDFGTYHAYCDHDATALFTENETNSRRLWGLETPGFFKDAFHERIVDGNLAAVNPARKGTKAAFWAQRQVPAKSSVTLRVRLTNRALAKPFENFQEIL
jgi:hypothetical protein